MTDLSRHNPTGRFTGLADLYARCRPDYPASAVDYILTTCRLGALSLLVDVGSGTGIAARLFALRGVPVLGIEPNAEMRARAEAESVPAGVPRPVYRDGRAEATGLNDASADAVLAAQAFHWFDADPALREFHRILKPAGWVVLLANERDDADAFTAAYGEVFARVRGAAAYEARRARAGGALLTCPLFPDAEHAVLTHEQVVDRDGLLGRAFSASYAPREPAEAAAFEQGLRDVFARYQQDGRVAIRYRTLLYLGQRGTPASGSS